MTESDPMSDIMEIVNRMEYTADQYHALLTVVVEWLCSMSDPSPDLMAEVMCDSIEDMVRERLQAEDEGCI